MWETLGWAMKRVGKATGSQKLIEKGRQWQYGHLSPEQLMRQHPSAFLRTYAVQSHLEAPDRVGALANTQRTFQLRHDLGNATAFPHSMTHIHGNDGVTRTPKAHLHLIFDTDAAAHHGAHQSPQAGANFQAAFLPMRQVAHDKFGGGLRLTDQQIPQWQTGTISRSALHRQHEDLTLTTQLSGCTIAKRRDNMLHLRPAEDGATMHGTLPRASTFGRLDYPGQGDQAFVMMKQKNGRTRVYFQRHDPNTGHMHSGKKDL
ncbi:hypothetical protein DWU98_17485 [Dyella monticola]|uniref:Uncharacterized protein n=2 Tax=Dyella monticola TaxID=1927958 RepID=A0A370WTX6_9GAMM|nr:hypothetical protein DWU98_17485 [Dyella monticola]